MKYFLISFFLFFFNGQMGVAQKTNTTAADSAYFCPPCESHCDEMAFEQAGKCPHCNMTLVKQSRMELQNRKTKKRYSIGFYLQNGVEILDFAGPLEVFAYAGFDIYIISKTKKTIQSQGILSVTPDYDLLDAPSTDILAFFGGNSGVASNDKDVIDWINSRKSTTQYHFSVCTGAFIIGKAGILEGKTATTFHESIEKLKETFPNTQVLSDVRFVDNGKVITTAGISAGIDGALYLVSKLKGEEAAKNIAHYMEYDKWIPNQGLILSETSSINNIEIHEGSGTFLIEANKVKKNISLKVFYHKPKNFNPSSNILIAIPGDGRNGDGYRDDLISASEKYNVLVLSPMYEEKYYPFEDYQLGGTVHDLNLKAAVEPISGTNVVKVDESKVTIQHNNNADEWLFSDFDRIFDLAVKATKSNQKQYDMYGHSAGGQILHRFAIFHPNSKADRIIAANAGFYTLPDTKLKMPFGLQNSLVSDSKLKNSFAKKLIILAGELDNENEKGGSLMRSKTADLLGVHRFERAKNFYYSSSNIANQLQFNFNWKLETVPNVGHNNKKMSEAATKILYEK